MQVLFHTIINMSVAGSMTSLVTHLIKPVTSRLFSATWHYYVRFIIILLLLVPFSICFTSLEIELIKDDTYAEKESFAFEQLLLTEKNKDNDSFSKLPAEQNAGQPKAAALALYFVRNVISNLQYIWLGGVIVFTFLKLKNYLLYRNVIRENKRIVHGMAFDMLNLCKAEMGIKRNIRLVSNAAVGTPMLTGLFRPTIIIPDAEIEQEELWFIFKHELVHFMRGDLWIKAAALIANVLHWFNPISSLLVRRINCLCELSCDEAVVKDMDFPARKRYAETILCTLNRNITMPYVVYSAMYENKQGIKRRLTHMLKFKKKKKSQVLFSVAIAIILCANGIVASAARFSPANSLDVDTASTESKKAVIVADNIGEQYDPERKDIEGSMVWPTPDRVIITSYYGMKVHPILKKQKMHTGIDIAGTTGDSIVAANKGTVIVAEWQSDNGNTIVTDHGGGITTFYSHCSRLLVKAGDEVAAGQVIAEIGSTGLSTGPHLHFEVRKDGKAQNPLDYVSLQKK